MSLIKQLWLAIVLITLLSLGGSFIVSALSARHYLQQELAVKNMDNAASLALSLSQMPKDPVTVELQIAAQFDTGHYRLIRLVGPTGRPLVERHYEGAQAGAPDWFVRLIPIETHAGIAQVQDGWRQFGTLSVETHSRYAYDSLWKATRQLLLWFIVGGILTGLVGTLALKLITRPLGRMVAQAEAIGGRRFVTTPEPRTLEFRSVVRALNALSGRVRSMLAEEAQRLEALRRQTQHDELTGLFNRSQFLKQLDAALARDDAAAGGALFIARISPLGELNQRHGRAATDRLLAALGASFRAATANRPDWDCGRLNAAEFALLAPCESDHPAALAALADALRRTLEAHGCTGRIYTAAARYAAGDAPGALLARLDGALAAAEQEGDEDIRFTPDTAPLYTNLDDWRRALEQALGQHRLALGRHPVTARDGSLLHHEAPVRLQLDGEWRHAGQFLPWAARLGLLAQIDALAAAAACARLEDGREDGALAINLSAALLRDDACRHALVASLQARPRAAARLWIDIQESTALHHQLEFRTLCAALRPLGCRIGLKHAGQHLAHVGELHDLGLDYIKISSAFVRDIGTSPGNASFLRGLCTVAHSIGVIAIAEGVATAAESSALLDLGVDGLTGPGVGAGSAIEHQA